MRNLIAQADVWGPVTRPPGVTGGLGGLQSLINIGIRTLIVAAGIYAVINIVLAGLAYISAGNDPKKIGDAGARIWQSLLGLTIAAGSFVLAALVGELLFGDPQALLQLKYWSL